MSKKPTLVLGSYNPGKLIELKELLGDVEIEILSLTDFPEAREVVEDGDTFAANAEKKACEQAARLGRWVLAEDSGLSADALSGAPGVYSARYAGENADDEQNNQKLLAALAETPLEQRTARYVCHAALSDSSGKIRARREETCEGRIALQPRGTNGFGYDPLFEVLTSDHPDGETFGILSAEIKHQLSHRGKATRAILPELIELLTSSAE
ncbi:MAG: non-canonical purine NTP pyrophosphatase [Planctomycetales bacterium]